MAYILVLKLKLLKQNLTIIKLKLEIQKNIVITKTDLKTKIGKNKQC
jgi:hypothetical protein